MGSSKAKKSAKKADFQKPKLKVGKTRPAASNVTSTSFRTKGIVLKDQALTTSLPSIDAQISTHVAHLSSRSESQRKESLAALVNAAARTQLPTQIILERALPLITDGSSAVREQLILLLQTLPADQCKGFESRVVLYLQTGLTHIASGVCRTALELVAWAMKNYGVALVSCPGGWYKIIKCFLLLLGWKHDETSRSNAKEWAGSGTAIEKINKEPKLMAKVLEAFSAFLSLGLRVEKHDDNGARLMYPGFAAHLIPVHAKPFAHLGLFEGPTDVETQLYPDMQARRAVFEAQFRPTIQRGIQVVKRHGGELGRAAGDLSKVVGSSGT